MMKSRIGKPQKSRKNTKLKNVNHELYKPSRKEEQSRRIGGQNTDQQRKASRDRRNRKSGAVNQRPTNVDEQEVSYTMREFMRLKQEAKEQPTKKRKKKNPPQDKEERRVYGMNRPLKSIPDFGRRPGESEWAWNRRIDNQTRDVISQANLESKFNVKIDHNEEGDMTITSRKKSKKKEKMALRLKNKKEVKKQAQQLSRGDKCLDFDDLSDHVEFGDVVTQPPVLSARPRKSADISADKAGKKSLLLKSIMEGLSGTGSQSAVQDDTSSGGGTTSKKRQLGQVVKRKKLAPVQQRIMDAKRLEAIDRYRQLKKKKS